ncbi:MAG: chemotaxis protein CheW [Phycisphaerales bacterium]|jgi:chemotaxis-related protein WspB|nr:chemotaxis protein CheW [Phycisphaerales bacterium]
MQVLELTIAGKGFVIPTERVEEVVPAVRTRSLSDAPAWIRGVFDHRGTLIPLLDLHLLIEEEAARTLIGSRIIIINVDQALERADGSRRTIGLMVERIQEVLEVESPGENDFSGIAVESRPYLREILHSEDRTLQLIDPDRILRSEHQEILFGSPSG